MKRYLIIINGLGGTGKSEFIKQCNNATKKLNAKIGVEECSTVDYVKEIATLCGWDGEKSAEDRVFLSNLKQTLEEWDNVPYKKTMDKIQALWNEMEWVHCDYGLVFVNSREEKDINRFCQDVNNYGGDAIKVYIDNPRVENNEVPELLKDIYDFAANCDYYVENTGSLEQLFMSAICFMQDLLKVGEKNEEK